MRVILVLVFFLLGLWLAGFISFYQAIPRTITDETTTVDAVVILTGGPKRIDDGLQLIDRGLAPRAFISGVHERVVLPELITQNPKLSCCVELGYEASNTIQNAWEVRSWVQRHQIRSLRLVTSAYHMPRSLLLHRRILPSGTVIIPHPVLSAQLQAETWYENPKIWRQLLLEYHKYLFTWIV